MPENIDKDLFSHTSYKAYILDRIKQHPKRGRGLRMSLAHSLRCPVSHISQVLNASSHLSLEQAEGVNEFFGHTSDEADFFLLLVQLERAGSTALKQRLQGQLKQALDRRFSLKDRLGVKATLTREDQAIFYSSWIYGAVHVMLSIPEFQSKDAISRYLGISPKKVGEVIEFLQSIGLALPAAGGRYVIGTERIHLEADSPMIARFHSNWRLHAMRSFDNERRESNLHYSSVVTLSETDIVRIKTLLVRHIAEIKSIIRDSKEERVYCFSLDFFQV